VCLSVFASKHTHAHTRAGAGARARTHKHTYAHVLTSFDAFAWGRRAAPECGQTLQNMQSP